jgi:hypothetical protein
MKKLWEKIKAWLLAKWTVVKAWVIAKPWAWLKKHWFMVVNYVVIALAYNNIYGKEGVVGAEVLLGLWIFFSIAYAGWKWFTKSNKLNPQPEPPKPKK